MGLMDKRKMESMLYLTKPGIRCCLIPKLIIAFTAMCYIKNSFVTGYNWVMEEPVIRKLLSINLEFYQTFAVTFSATRMRLQPGVLKILNSLPHQLNILEVGCGNGELARNLADRGHKGVYIGLDFSSELLEIARTSLTNTAKVNNRTSDQGKTAEPESYIFLQSDLTSKTWDNKVRERINSILNDRQLDLIFAFSTLHHLPGKANLIQILNKFFSLLNDGGRLIHSNWQFLNSERLSKRILPWRTIELSQEDVDAGDYLLDWRQGGYGLRYVHHFKEEELRDLAYETGFKVIKSFLSDGKSGNLGLYQVWEKSPRSM